MPDDAASTEHKLQIGKKALEYTATCGTLLLREPDAGDSLRRALHANPDMRAFVGQN